MSHRLRPALLGRTLALLPLLLLPLPLLAACAVSAGGPDYAAIGVGAGRAGAVADLECTWLPVMPGGIVERELELNGGIRARLRGTRDGAKLDFSGIEDPDAAARRFSHETLDNRVSERIGVVTLGGDDYVILVTSDCDTSVTF